MKRLPTRASWTLPRLVHAYQTALAVYERRSKKVWKAMEGRPGWHLHDAPEPLVDALLAAGGRLQTLRGWLHAELERTAVRRSRGPGLSLFHFTEVVNGPLVAVVEVGEVDDEAIPGILQARILHFGPVRTYWD